MTDPLLVTLIVLPLVVAGLGLIGRWAGKGETDEPGLLWGLEIISVAALGVLILGRSSLGLEADATGLDEVLAGGLLVLLALHIARLVPRLAQRLADDPTERTPWPFFLLPLVVYLAILPWSGGQREPDGDEPYFLLITHSLAYDLDTDLANNYSAQDSLSFLSRPLEPSWADPMPREGRRYSRHSPLLPLLLVPGYRLAGKWGAMVTMAVFASVVAWLGLTLFRRYWGRTSSRSAVVVWALLALTPPLLLYSYQIWTELPAAVLVLAALLEIQDLESKRGRAVERWLRLALFLLLLPLLKLRFAVLSVSLAALGWWRGGRSWRVLIWIALTVVVAVAGMLTYNQIVFDKPFKDHTLAQLFEIQGRPPVDYLRGVSGLFWDCAFGLVASNPLWLLLIPAMLLALRSRPRALFDLLVCSLPYLALVSPRREWYGAWSPPFRFGLALLPLAGLLLVPLVGRVERAGARILIGALSLLTMALTLLWVVVPGWTYNLAVGTNHLIDYLSIQLAADVGRLMPSMVRPRAATWSVPVLVTLTVIGLWWWPRKRPIQAMAWGSALLLSAVAAVPLIAKRLPSGWIELEDRQVVKQGGQLYPDPWTPYRPRFRGGWMLGPGESVRTPVVAGAATTSIELEVSRTDNAGEPMRLIVRAADHPIGELVVSPGRGWQTLTLTGIAWPTHADLVIEAESDESAAAGGRVVLDRVRFSWE